MEQRVAPASHASRTRSAPSCSISSRRASSARTSRLRVRSFGRAPRQEAKNNVGRKNVKTVRKDMLRCAQQAEVDGGVRIAGTQLKPDFELRALALLRLQLAYQAIGPLAPGANFARDCARARRAPATRCRAARAMPPLRAQRACLAAKFEEIIQDLDRRSARRCCRRSSPG